MSAFFLKIVNMSISASWLVLVVLLLRLVLKKAPKWVSVLLWGFVAIRLICPFSLESVFSLIPSTETISPEIMTDWTPEISTGITSVDTVVNPIITESFAPKPYASANPLQILIPVFGNLWILGILVMLIYTAVSYILLRRRVATAVLLRDNIYQSENVDSPFVLGVVKPKIYLPFQIDAQDLVYVIAHEQSHIHRKDHWWKPMGFLLLSIHWFNPLMWLGYILLCRDIELACDEKVIREMDSESKADYTQAFVTCSVDRRSIAACPLAFGEVGVKQRVKAVMHYKKPAFWLIIAAVIICVVTAVCFLTDPAASTDEKPSAFIDDSVYVAANSKVISGAAVDENDRWVTKPESKLDAAIASAILSRTPQAAEGILRVESHVILANWTVSDEPLPGQTNHFQETTVFLYYMSLQFEIKEGIPAQPDGIYGYAILTFEINDAGAYTLKTFLDPKSSADYDAELMKMFSPAAEDAAKNELENKSQLFTRCQLIATDYIDNREAGNSAQPGGIVYTPIIDSISYDLDGDGKDEMCTLTYGPTSGLFSFCFYASPMEATAVGAKYSETYILSKAYRLSFETTAGSLRIKAEDSDDPEKVTYFDLVLRDGSVFLQGEENDLFIGGSSAAK